MTSEVVLRYEPCKLAITPTFFCKVLLILKITAGEFYSLLVVDWVYCRSVTVKGIPDMEKIMGLNFVVESGSEVWQGKPRLAVASDQTDWWAVVKRLGYIKYLNVCWNVATNWVLLTESGYYLCHFLKSKVRVCYPLST